MGDIQSIRESLKRNLLIESFKDSAYLFDLDNTLFNTDAKIIVLHNGKPVKKLTPEEFNTYQKQNGESFDFSQFDDPDLFMATAKPTYLLKVIKQINDAIEQGRSNSKIYLLTARSAKVKDAVLSTLAKHGVNNIAGYLSASEGTKSGKSIAEVKKEILQKVRAKHMGKVKFFDDDDSNVQLAKSIPGVKAYKAKTMGESWNDDEDGDSPWESLYMSQFSGINTAVRRMGLDINSVRLINTNRTNLTSNNIKDISEGFHQWYSIGTAWLDWIQRNMTDRLKVCNYAIEFAKEPLTIKTPKLVQMFERKYIIDPERPKDSAINWKLLYENGVGAIEFNPYDKGFRPSKSSLGWYSSIDMASGAIVNKSIIKNVVKLYDGTDDFKDAGVNPK